MPVASNFESRPPVDGFSTAVIGADAGNSADASKSADMAGADTDERGDEAGETSTPREDTGTTGASPIGPDTTTHSSRPRHFWSRGPRFGFNPYISAGDIVSLAAKAAEVYITMARFTRRPVKWRRLAQQLNDFTQLLLAASKAIATPSSEELEILAGSVLEQARETVEMMHRRFIHPFDTRARRLRFVVLEKLLWATHNDELKTASEDIKSYKITMSMILQLHAVESRHQVPQILQMLGGMDMLLRDVEGKVDYVLRGQHRT